MDTQLNKYLARILCFTGLLGLPDTQRIDVLEYWRQYNQFLCWWNHYLSRLDERIHPKMFYHYAAFRNHFESGVDYLLN